MAIRYSSVLGIFLALSLTLFAQSSFRDRLVTAAISLTEQQVTYNGTYYTIPYPNGDVPAGVGVCTDVIIRAYRKCGIDLQREVHEDMVANFSIYPKTWGLKSTDTNIDHRRVPNLMKFFSRKGSEKPKTENNADYVPGDIVAWDLGAGLTHIGLVVNKKGPDGNRWLVVHNIGRGQEISDCLFQYKVIGHYSYTGSKN